MRTVNDEEKTAKFSFNVVRIHIVIEEAEKESESNVNESEAVYHHDCGEAYEPSTTFELANSERELDRHALACSSKKVRALRSVNVTRVECSNETDTIVPVCKSLCRTCEREP